MKQTLPALGLMIAFLSIGAAPPPQQARAEKLFGPSANLHHDFGTVPRGAQLRHDFVITNVYAVPIEITRVKANECAAPVKASLDRYALQPNEKAIISVRMDARRFVGRKTGSIWVTVDSPSGSTVELTVTAVSRPDPTAGQR